MALNLGDWLRFVYFVLNRQPSFYTTIDIYCWLKQFIRVFNKLPWQWERTTTYINNITPNLIMHFTPTVIYKAHPNIPRCTTNKIKTIHKIFLKKQYMWVHLPKSILPFNAAIYPIPITKDTILLAPPFILFYNTDIHINMLNGKTPIGVIGTRSPTIYSLQNGTALLVQILSGSSRIYFVSGRARGCDHLAAYVSDLLNRPITNVIAQIDYKTIPYHNEILISEYINPLHKHTFKIRLILRNRIISLLNNKLIILQSPIKSGTLITANFQRLLGKPIYILKPEENSYDYLGGIRLKQTYSKANYIFPYI